MDISLHWARPAQAREAQVRTNLGHWLCIKLPLLLCQVCPSGVAQVAQVHLPSAALDFSSGLIRAPILYDTSRSISSIPLAWSEWNHGSTTIAEGQADQS